MAFLPRTCAGRQPLAAQSSLHARRPAGRWTGELAVYSARTGALLHTTARWVWRWPAPPGRGGLPAQTLAWTTDSGGRLVLLQPRNHRNILGVATAGTFRPAGGKLLPQQPAGYRELQYALRTSSQVAW